MSEQHDEDTEEDIPTAGSTDVKRTAISSTYKVRGEDDLPDGTGVLGNNTASSGTPIGVEGTVPNNASGGYGLATPHDARVDGTAVLGALNGSVTGGTEITNLAGENLDVDGSGTLNSSADHTFASRSFDAAGETWEPLSNLSGETPVEVTADGSVMESGTIVLAVDGVKEDEIEGRQVLHRVVGASSSVSIRSEVPVWQLPGASFDSSVDVSGEDEIPLGLAFKDDGTRMFVSGSSTDSVYSYALSTAWDISTATVLGSFDVSSEDGSPTGVQFKDDGTEMFVMGELTATVYDYTLSTAWDITTATLDSSLDVSADDSSHKDIAFKSDGTKLNLVAGESTAVHSYVLSSAWDVTSATFAGSLDVSGQDSGPSGLAFKGDGSKVFVSGSDSATIFSYELSTPWDVTTATAEGSTDVSSEDSNPRAVAFKRDGTKMFMVALNPDQVYSYDITYTGTAYATVKTT